MNELAKTEPALLDLASLSRSEQESIWRRLYHQHFDSIYRLVRGLGVDAVEAEDVLQKVFLIAHRHLSQGRTAVENPLAWLRGVAVRVVREHYRWWRVRRLKRWLLESTLEVTAPQPASPEGRAVSQETQERARRIIAGMRPKLREALVLLDLEDLPLQEVTELLRVPANTLRSRRRLARAEFQRLWRQEEQGVDHG